MTPATFPTLPDPPWADVPVVNDPQNQDAQGAVVELSGKLWGSPVASRFAGLWLTAADGKIGVDVSLVAPTDADVAMVDSFVKDLPALTYSVQVVSVPRSDGDLQAYYAAIESTVDQGKSMNPGDFSLEIRPDLGLVVATVPDDLSAETLSQSLNSVVPEAAYAIQIAKGDGTGTMLFDRAVVPKYLSGKRIFIPEVAINFPGEGNCSTGYIFVTETGPPVLRGSTAGHCALAGYSANDARNINFGSFINPNTFWQGTAQVAPGDFTQTTLNPNIISDGPVQKVILLDTSQGHDVTTWVRNASITPGSSACISAEISGYACGIILTVFPTRRNGLHYNDLVGFGTPTRDVRNLVCMSRIATSGDSGGPVFSDFSGSQPHASALGMLSNNPTNGVETCFDPIGHINSLDGVKIWQATPVG